MTSIEEAQAKETPAAANKTKVKILVRSRPTVVRLYDSLFVARQPLDFISRVAVVAVYRASCTRT